METENNEYFDLPILLKQDILNIRKFTAFELSVTTVEYFSMVSELLRLAPDTERALYKFTIRDAAIDDYKSLDKMIILLENMGCEKFIFDFHYLLDAYSKKGNWREAATRAKQIKEEFNEFCLLIRKAKITMKSAAPPDWTLSLNKYIKHLDDEEANRKPLILAVDDSPVILKSVSSVLSNDYKVFTLPKPTEMEKVLRKLTPDLFLLDYQMPELNGFDLIPIIRSFKEHEDTPIVFLTSEGTFDNVTAALAFGICDFIIKPFKPDLLRERIANHIIKKKSF